MNKFKETAFIVSKIKLNYQFQNEQISIKQETSFKKEISHRIVKPSRKKERKGI